MLLMSVTPTRRSMPTRWRAGTARSATRSSSSPGPTSTGTRSQGQPPRTGRIPRSGRTGPRRGSTRRGGGSTSRTTISSERASPATTSPSRSSSRRVYDNGFIELGTYAGWYCVGCEAYKDESELLEGHICPDHLLPVEWLEEENYFFKLSAFQDRLLEWYEAKPSAVLPSSKRNEALSFIKGGLNDISITRTSTKWGVPVPWDDRHVFYVWYDALINYLTAIGYGDDEARFESWWPAVHHLIGKEIIRFHCVWWPAMCMAAGIDPPAHVQVHGWLLRRGTSGSRRRASGASRIEPSSSPRSAPKR